MKYCTSCRKDETQTKFIYNKKMCISCRDKYHNEKTNRVAGYLIKECLKCELVKPIKSNNRCCDMCNQENSSITLF